MTSESDKANPPPSLHHRPVSLESANAFIERHHRHHKPVRGHKYSIAAYLADALVGVVIVGRPVSRIRDDGLTLEITRLCTDGTRNACSFLTGKASRAAFALGFKRIGTYILLGETGIGLRAAGWKLISETRGGSWDCPSRPRTDKHPTVPKALWELRA